MTCYFKCPIYFSDVELFVLYYLGIVFKLPIKMQISIELQNENSRAKHESVLLQDSQGIV